MAEFKVDIKAIQKAYDQRNLDELHNNSYKELMYKTLFRLIKQQAVQWSARAKGNVLASVEELIQEAALEILKRLDAYNPYESLPSTYFMIRIEGVMKDLSSSYTIPISTHYSHKVAEADRILKEAGIENGIRNPAVTIDLIVDVCNIPVKTATVIYSAAKQEFSKLEDAEYLEANTTTPEEAYINSETFAELAEACTELTPFERYVVYNTRGCGVSYRSLVTILKSESSYIDEFSLRERQITSEFIKQIESTAIRKLKRKLSPPSYKDEDGDDVFIQASEEDIYIADEEAKLFEIK